MASVFVSIGSNQMREHYVTCAISSLREYFGTLQLSAVYESEAVGFEGDNFYNLVAQFETDLGVEQLSQTLKQIEDDHGRCRKGPKFSGRTLDIDILTYDEQVGNIAGVELPRDEITRNAFVLKPLADIAPMQLHPQLQVAYEELWQSYDQTSQSLWAVGFTFEAQSLPCELVAIK